MLSDKVRRILVSKGAPFSEADLEGMSDADAWAWIYAQREHKPEPGPAICFTGFSPDEKARLQGLAEASGLSIAKTVTKKLRYLCTGSNAGPAKVAKAKAQGVQVLTEAEFLSLARDSDQ